jgi:hypothetical protein
LEPFARPKATYESLRALVEAHGPLVERADVGHGRIDSDFGHFQIRWTPLPDDRPGVCWLEFDRWEQVEELGTFDTYDDCWKAFRWTFSRSFGQESGLVVRLRAAAAGVPDDPDPPAYTFESQGNDSYVYACNIDGDPGPSFRIRPVDELGDPESEVETGFSWGYAGGGPWNLATALLYSHLGFMPRAGTIKMFVLRFLAEEQAPQFSIPLSVIDRWIDDNYPEDEQLHDRRSHLAIVAQVAEERAVHAQAAAQAAGAAVTSVRSVSALLAMPESSQVTEFKRHIDRDREYLRQIMAEIAAFLNSEGGTLVAGVDDDRTVRGISQEELDSASSSPDRERQLDRLAGQVAQWLAAGVGSTAMRFVKVHPTWLDGLPLIRIDVQPSTQPVFVTLGGVDTFYHRSGESKVPIPNGQKLAEYLLSGRFGRLV